MFVLAAIVQPVKCPVIKMHAFTVPKISFVHIAHSLAKWRLQESNHELVSEFMGHLAAGDGRRLPVRRSGVHLTAGRQVTRTEKRRAATAAEAGHRLHLPF